MNMTEHDDGKVPARCAWHSEEIEALKDGAEQRATIINGLVSDVRLIAERIPTNLATTLATVQLEVRQALVGIAAVDKKVSDGYVRREEYGAFVERYKLVEKMVFAVVGLICLSVLSALVYSVILRGKP
jgi:hypothetical protein